MRCKASAWFFHGWPFIETVKAEPDSNIVLIPQSQKHLEGTKRMHKGVN